MIGEHAKSQTDVRARRIGGFRMSVLLLSVLVITGLVVVRLVDLQIVNARGYSETARKNCLRDVPIPAMRSAIVDRNGARLAVDIPQYRLVKVRNNGLWDEELIGFEEASSLEENGSSRDQYVEAIPKRTYPAAGAAAHVTGYIGSISPRELKMYGGAGYRPGDRVGKSGLERSYEVRLNGSRGRKILFVNSRGSFLNDLATEAPYSEKPFRCTVDLRLQQAAYSALAEQNKPGALIMMDSNSGEILAMATYPSFNNNLTSDGLHQALWNELKVDPGHPLLNRAISVSVPLGSVFKLVVASGALEEKVITPEQKFHCPGSYSLGRFVFRCWTRHGSVSLLTAISRSCDVYFYQVGRKLGVTNIKKYAKMLGLGGKTGIDLPGESIGLIPDPEWKKTFRRAEWMEGDTVNMSTGQGYVQVSPVQVLVMANVFATRGYLVRPHLGRDAPRRAVRVKLSPKTIELVRAGMRGAVLGGTCGRFGSLDITSAGKTGTAEDPPRQTPHAWFVGFAPFENPKISYVVFVENGGQGSSDALPLALKVVQRAIELGYFGEDAKIKQKGFVRK